VHISLLVLLVLPVNVLVRVIAEWLVLGCRGASERTAIASVFFADRIVTTTNQWQRYFVESPEDGELRNDQVFRRGVVILGGPTHSTIEADPCCVHGWVRGRGCYSSVKELVTL